MKLGTMGKMVGPLPLGAWVATVGGAVAVTQVAKLRGKKKTPAADGEALPVYNAGALPFAPMQEPMWGGAVGLGGGVPSPPMPAAGAAAITNNTEWQRQAAADLAARGYGAYGAQQALAKYLQGLDQLTAAEAAMVEAALRYTGYPPQPPSIAPPPAAPAAPAPTGSRKPGYLTDVGRPMFISGSNITRTPGGAAIAIDQFYDVTASDLPADWGAGVTGIHFDVDPTTDRLTSGYWWQNGQKVQHAQSVLDFYQAHRHAWR